MNQQTAKGAPLAKPPLGLIYGIQCIVLLMGAVGIGLIFGLAEASSAVIGGLISIGPNSYFARWAFRFSGAKSASNVARAFYIGEAGKFILTALLFAMVFLLIKPINAVVIFLTFIFMTALNWYLALRLLKR